MDRSKDYVVNSLEQHLFFARIMKEHAFFLKVSLLPPDENLAKEGECILRQFEALLSQTITLSNNVVRSCVLNSGEVFTEFTDRAECQTQRFTGTLIDRELTARTMCLSGRNCDTELRVSQALVCQVRRLNREGLTLVERIIAYKERLLCDVNSCRIFTVSCTDRYCQGINTSFLNELNSLFNVGI